MGGARIEEREGIALLARLARDGGSSWFALGCYCPSLLGSSVC
jgi:hypothetical protein